MTDQKKKRESNNYRAFKHEFFLWEEKVRHAEQDSALSLRLGGEQQFQVEPRDHYMSLPQASPLDNIWGLERKELV